MNKNRMIITFVNPDNTSGSIDSLFVADVTSYVKNISIDPSQMIDRDNLMINERKCSVTLNHCIGLFDNNLVQLNEMTDLIDVNSLGQTEYDMDHNGNQINRWIKFINPFVQRTVNTHSMYHQGKYIFPCKYNPDNVEMKHVFIPARYWYEEPYVAVENEYVIEQPFLYNAIANIYNNNLLIFTGVLEISSFSFDGKTKDISLSFIDITGILISCMNKIGDHQSYFQEVANSGLMLKDIYDIPHLLISNMYPQISSYFYIPMLVFEDVDLSIQLKHERGVYYPQGDHSIESLPTVYSVVINNGNGYPAIQFIDEPRDGIYIFRPAGNSMIPYFEDQRYWYRKIIGNSIILTFLELYLHWDYYVIKTEFMLEVGGVGLVYWQTLRTEYEMPSSELNALFNSYDSHNCILYEDEWGHNLPHNHIYQRTTTLSAIFNYVNGDTLPQNILNIVNIANMGFVSDVTTTDAIKILLLSHVSTIYSDGSLLIWRRLIIQNGISKSINGRYITSIKSTKEYYEKPDMKSIEDVVNWKQSGIKKSILSMIDIVPEGINNKYDISISNVLNEKISVGDIIRFTNMNSISSNGYMEFPDNIDIIIVSVSNEDLETGVSGYAI